MAVIQWYPGHMNKAKNQLADKLDLIDVIVEVLDARIPISSRNPMIENLIGTKPHVIILNKADLADPVLTKRWQAKLSQGKVLVLAMDALHKTNVQGLVHLIRKAASAKIKKMQAKGAATPVIRIALAGIPNCGKSTIINRLVGHNAAIVGNKPGVTKGQSWLKTKENIQIMDTPGILWPKFSDQIVGLNLAAFGAIKDSVFPADDVALHVLAMLRKYYQRDLAKLARIDSEELANINDPDLLLALTQSYGMRDDYDRFSLFMLQRLRKGKIGRVTFDRP
jgi:ribosome biogenesis GTPase A